MKLVINPCFGGFSVSDKAEKHILAFGGNLDRDNEIFARMVESMPELFEDLEVIEIPDEATDYYINEYDGAEEVLYVLDGKIHFAE